MNGIKNTGFQNINSSKPLVNKNNSSPAFNKGANFQAALGNAKRRDFGDHKHQNPVLSPAPLASVSSTNNTTTASTSNNTNTSSGIGANNGLRGNVIGARSGNANQEKVEQELENELVQSGLQAQVLKSNPPTSQESD